MNLLVFGSPGSGKGTQASRLKERGDLMHISTGDLLRSAVSTGSELGKKVEGILSAGDLVSDDIVLTLIREAVAVVSESDEYKGWILDGFPRTLGQALGLDSLLQEASERIDAIVVLNVDRKEVMTRLLARARGDDNKETISNRLDVYYAQTRPVLDHYEGNVTIHRINGTQSMDEVTADIERSLA